jgi:hypothetical protein
MQKSKALKKRGIISLYKILLKKNRVQQNGPAYKRMRKLEIEYIKETRWLSQRSQDVNEITFGWQTKNLN